MNRLNNAVKQRDTAREEALLATQKLTQLQEDIDSGALTPASAARSSSPADPGGILMMSQNLQEIAFLSLL